MRGAQTVFRAVSILETFEHDRPTLTLAEISEAVGLTGPTAHRLLRALQSHDLIVFDAQSRTYSLGPGVMRLASVLLNRDDILAIVQPSLRDLREATGETAALHWRVNAERVCLIEYVSNHPIRMASGVGNSYPLAAGAAGKAILSALDPEDVEHVLQAATDAGTKVNRRALMSKLEEIRERGFATSVGEPREIVVVGYETGKSEV
jgi:DNA-binding IclR family transcriptional regulator